VSAPDQAIAERKMIHVRLSRALVKRLDRVALETDVDRARIVERVIEAGLPQIESSVMGA